MIDLKRVAILMHEGVPAFEFSCALEIFALPRPELDLGYQCEVLAVDTLQVESTGGVQISIKRDIQVLHEFGTVVVPGWPTQPREIPATLQRGLKDLMAKGGRILTICSGSFLLAQLGLLEGKQATTHWNYSEQFSRRFPNVNLQSDVLYTEDQNIYTSAGSSAGLDLGLHIIRQDFGYQKANSVARRLVMSPQRSGGQAQYIEQPLVKQSNRFSETLDWALKHLDQPISVEQMAATACLSRRSFDRQFRSSLAMSPKQWLIQQRLARACELLESSTINIDQVAEQTGFEKAINLRLHFKRLKGISPNLYREQFSGSYAGGL